MKVAGLLNESWGGAIKFQPTHARSSRRCCGAFRSVTQRHAASRSVTQCHPNLLLTLISYDFLLVTSQWNSMMYDVLMPHDRQCLLVIGVPWPAFRAVSNTFLRKVRRLPGNKRGGAIF